MKFTVVLTREVIEEAEVTVKAANAQEAGERAKELAASLNKIDDDGCKITWGIQTDDSPLEIDSVDAA